MASNTALRGCNSRVEWDSGIWSRGQQWGFSPCVMDGRPHLFFHNLPSPSGLLHLYQMGQKHIRVINLLTVILQRCGPTGIEPATSRSRPTPYRSATHHANVLAVLERKNLSMIPA